MEEHTGQEPSNTNMEPCFLLELPGELRNDIFSLALYYPNGVAIDCASQKLLTPHPLALTATCKQVRKECGDPHFSQNEIRFEAGQGSGSAKVPQFVAFCKYMILNSQLGSKFQGVNVVTAIRDMDRDSPFTTIIPLHIRRIFDMCIDHRLVARLSLKTISGGSIVAYNIPMQDLESALKGVDRGLAHGGNTSWDPRQFFHEKLKRDLGSYFKFWRKDHGRVEVPEEDQGPQVMEGIRGWVKT